MKTKIFRNMKIVALLLLLPTGLWAQNGVTVSNLAVNTGTVTFNVSWDANNPDMPALWSDTVWVFVDYNDAGVMKRLPLAPGATLTSTSPGGKVIEETGNNKGVWVVGNARTAGNFSATVKLLTATADLNGLCAYAINYPPVAEYTSASNISFKGTPPYDLVFKSGNTLSIDSSPYVLTEALQSFTDATGAPGIINCTPPGATVNFTAFNPCNAATTGDYWYLTDTREEAYGNTQTYKVKKMADGHIWMVQDLKFGDKCKKTTFAGSSGKDQTGNVTSLKDKTYYGDCSNVRISSSPANRGYYYNWAAAINKSGAYIGSAANVGCSGTAPGASGRAPGACPGLCPKDWHVPTGASDGEFYALHIAGGCSSNPIACWASSSPFEGVIAGLLDLAGLPYELKLGIYVSSTYHAALYVGEIVFGGQYKPASTDARKDKGYTLRCVMNY
jgi:uncharacterized protein (TIGR02145 family)